jgi:hypothetical protein
VPFPAATRRVARLPSHVTVILRTSRWQLASIVVGWLVSAFVVTFMFSASPSPVGAALSAVVLAYMWWTYPVSSIVTPESVTVRSVLRHRVVPWSQVTRIRRTKGVWRQRTVEGRRRLRPAPGAIVLVLGPRRTILILGHVESREDNELVVAAVGATSAALADSLRLATTGHQ